MIVQFPKYNQVEKPFKIQRPVLTTGHIIDSGYVDRTPKKRKSAADPIKKIEDIYKISDYLVANERYRDNLIFIMGINFGLRCGDLLQTKIGDLIQVDGEQVSYKPELSLIEQKTKKIRRLFTNKATMSACDLYFSSLLEIDLDNYLFTSNSNNGRNANKPLCVFSIERMLKQVINKDLGIDIHAGTHCLRKTFAYHVIQSAPERARAIEFLQKILGHSSQQMTLQYAGITDDEIENVYQKLNLGYSAYQKDIFFSSGVSAS